MGDLTVGELQQWAGLAARAEEPNPFLEPAFVVPLTRTLACRDDIRVLAVIDKGTGDWIAAGAFQCCGPSLTRPLPHLRSLRSRYSFIDSLLFDHQHLDHGVRGMIEFLALQRQWHGVRFRCMRATGRQSSAIRDFSEGLGLSVLDDRTWRRPETDLSQLSGSSLLDRASKSRRKSLNKSRRWLTSCGEIRHRLLRPMPDDTRPVDEFLRLESLGWKGTAGTAMNSRPHDAVFFREMIAGFAGSGRAVFGELLVGEQVIASTCNLLSGRTLFAFKVGWNPEYARGNPGHWAEIELAEAVRAELPDVTLIDSCSQEGSYLESVATGSHLMSSSVFVWSKRGQVLCNLRRRLQSVKSMLGKSIPESPKSGDRTGR